ncbi:MULTISPECIES: nucleotide exchange factor GrpE [unclassified Dinoroseobacter]|uniref:nucleotide exchange factor GrpE n=1 Tax=unclassified Dinoroseobacter TaxID=2620028 RepID=UPI003C7BEFDA
MADPKTEEDIFAEVDAEIAAEEEAANAEMEAALAEEGPDAPGPGVEAIIAERDELKDRLMRSLAEAENIRKRGERDRREAEQYGGSKLARDMLPVFDNLRRALDTVDDSQREIAGGMIEGVELTMREILNVFGKHGITPIAPEVGDTFDPQLHQAMFEAPVPNIPAGGIIQVMSEGFLLHDRLLRPAHVGVSSTPAS